MSELFTPWAKLKIRVHTLSQVFISIYQALTHYTLLDDFILKRIIVIKLKCKNDDLAEYLWSVGSLILLTINYVTSQVTFFLRTFICANIKQ